MLRRTTHLIAICVLFAACNAIETPGDRGGGGPGSHPTCYNYATPCVFSCASDSSTPALQDCELTGAISCPPASMLLSTCPPNACAQTPTPCCNETTGALEPPSCNPDGFWADCPSGSHSAADKVCIPRGFDVSHCTELKGRSCATTDQACWEGGAYHLCWCSAGDAGMTWSCNTNYL